MAVPMTGQLSQNKLGQKLGEKKKGTNWVLMPARLPPTPVIFGAGLSETFNSVKLLLQNNHFDYKPCVSN